MIDLTEGPVTKPSVLNAKGNVRRFFSTNKTYNAMSKFSRVAGYVGIAVAIYRIATAENKIKESTIVAGGFAGAWMGGVIAAPIAAYIGAKVALINPMAGVITAGALLGIGSILGGV